MSSLELETKRLNYYEFIGGAYPITAVSGDSYFINVADDIMLMSNQLLTIEQDMKALGHKVNIHTPLIDDYGEFCLFQLFEQEAANALTNIMRQYSIVPYGAGSKSCV